MSSDNAGARNGDEKQGPGQEQAAAGKRKRGRVVIKAGLCKGCGFCVSFCPRHTLVMSGKLNDKGYHFPEVDKDNCTGCDLCGMLCPDFAIYGFRVAAGDE